MARIRTIKPEFWEDEKVAKLPFPGRLLFIGMWNFADDQGVIRANPAILKAKIFPYDENLRVSEISKWLENLMECRMLIPITHNEESYYVIRTFKKHQKIDKRYGKPLIEEDILNKILSIRKEETPGTQRGNSEETPQEKEGKGNGKEKNYLKEEEESTTGPVLFLSFIASFNEIRNSHFRPTEKVKKQFYARIKEGFSMQDMLVSLQNAMKDKYHIETGLKYLTPEFFTRSDKIEKFLHFTEASVTVLGAGEWTEKGKRFYGNKNNPVEIPWDMPPRPSEKYYFNANLKQWNI